MLNQVLVVTSELHLGVTVQVTPLESYRTTTDEGHQMQKATPLRGKVLDAIVLGTRNQQTHVDVTASDENAYNG